MRSTRKRAVVALIAVAALGLAAACGTSKSSDNGGSSEPKLDNKALDSVVNPSDAEGWHPQDGPRRRLGRQLRPR